MTWFPWNWARLFGNYSTRETALLWQRRMVTFTKPITWFCPLVLVSSKVTSSPSDHPYLYVSTSFCTYIQQLDIFMLVFHWSGEKNSGGYHRPKIFLTTQIWRYKMKREGTKMRVKKVFWSKLFNTHLDNLNGPSEYHVDSMPALKNFSLIWPSKVTKGSRLRTGSLAVGPTKLYNCMLQSWDS